MPEYEEIEYNYSDFDFYITDGTETYDTVITFALDLKFDNKEEYESAKQNELSTRNFITEYVDVIGQAHPVADFNLGNYTCKTVEGSGHVRSNHEQLKLICFNDGSYVLRYLIFKAWRYGKNADYILKCTDCPWDN